MVDIRKEYTGAIFHVNGKNHGGVLYVERTKLPVTLVESKMDILGTTDDMQWGILRDSQHEHTIENFTLDKIEDINVIKATENEIKLSKETLINRLEKLAKLTSMGDMQKNNLDLVKYFVNNNNASKENFINDILTNKVFEHKETKDFEQSIVNALKDNLRKSEGTLRKVKISENDIKRPNFAKISDTIKGFTFAINYLQAYSVQVTEYAYNSERNKFDAMIEIALYDHFGLDFKDIEKFGTAENIIKQKKTLRDVITGTAFFAAGSLATAGVAISTESEETKKNMAIVSGALGAVSLATGALEAKLFPGAEGFRAWFILQHYYGCRPFITEMKKTIIFKNEQL
jgi:nicotinamide mononucleotide adenylyltransferase